MEEFFKTHHFLVEHTESSVHRLLMDEIDWNQRLIGIKGSRGVGKTTFLLDYAKRNFGSDESCLYANLNNFYFTGKSIIDFADEFRKRGGKVLLLDQIFKYPNWSKELRYCYDHFSDLKIIFTGSTIMRLKEENPELSGCVDTYYLRGFSFREYINRIANKDIHPFSLDEILSNHEEIAEEVLKTVNPLDYYNDYLHHGYYPFFLEKHDFSENLLKTINLVLEIDILLLKQIELSYLPKIRKLLYLIACSDPGTLNISQLSTAIQTSRATVMNYIKCLKDARLLNILYPEDEDYPKKPNKIYLQNPNLLYAFWSTKISEQVLRETFFYSAVLRKHNLFTGKKNAQFSLDGKYEFCICDDKFKRKSNSDVYYAIENIKKGKEKDIPLWMFGFLY